MKSKTLILIGALCLVSTSAFAAKTYVTNQGHTEVIFGWSHAGVSRQHGEFTTATGTLDLADKIEDSTIKVVIDTRSVSTGVKKLDEHLKNADFLEVDTYPEITFNSTGIKRTGDKTFDVTGDLTIHGVTRSVTLKAEMTHMGEHPLGSVFDSYKGDWLAFRASTEIDHMAFNVGKFSTGPIAIEINTEMKAR